MTEPTVTQADRDLAELISGEDQDAYEALATNSDLTDQLRGTGEILLAVSKRECISPYQDKDLSDRFMEAAAEIARLTVAHVEGVKMGLEAAVRAVDNSVDASTVDDCCLDHVGDAVAAIRNLDAEAIVREGNDPTPIRR